MIYCMSDIQAEYGRYLAMLDKIHFSDVDTMHILGDVIDRNPDGLEILKDILVRPNMIMILGNHTDMRRLACLRLDDMKEFYV